MPNPPETLICCPVTQPLVARNTAAGPISSGLPQRLREDRRRDAGRVARAVAGQVMQRGLPPGILLNVNIPALPFDEIRGIEVTRQARSRWEESFNERVDPFNQPYYWLTGRFVNLDEGENTDLQAIENGYVSVTPIHYDLTAYEYLEQLKTWSWESSKDEASGSPKDEVRSAK